MLEVRELKLEIVKVAKRLIHCLSEKKIFSKLKHSILGFSPKVLFSCFEVTGKKCTFPIVPIDIFKQK